MDWMLMPLRRYADFSGRSRRKEYWMFTLFYILVLFGLVAAAAATADSDSDADIFGSLFGIVMILFFVATLIPSIAVTVRRLHDQDKSGWWYLISLIPYLGGLVLFIFMCLDGTRGSNQYGSDPKGVDADIFT